MAAIDAHIHVWAAADRFDILIRRNEPKLAQDYDLEAYTSAMPAGLIRRVVLVQAAPDIGESEQLLELAARNATIAGVVAWVDLARSDASSILADWQTRFGRQLLGVRAMLNREPRQDWILDDKAVSSIAHLASQGLTLDVIAQPLHLPHLAILAATIPDLRIIVDHAGTPPHPKKSGWREWAESMARLAHHPSISTKLSGFWEAAGARLTMKTLRPTFDHLFGTFGGHRLMLATNWPVVELFAPASAWLADVEVYLEASGIDRAVRRSVRGGTAATIYGLEDKDQVAMKDADA